MMGDRRVVVAKNIDRMVVQDLEQLVGYVEVAVGSHLSSSSPGRRRTFAGNPSPL